MTHYHKEPPLLPAHECAADLAEIYRQRLIEATEWLVKRQTGTNRTGRTTDEEVGTMNNKLGRPKGSTIDPRLKREMARFRLPNWLNDELARIGNAGQLVERIIVSGLGLEPPNEENK